MTDQERKAMQMALDALDSCEFDYDNKERQVRTFDALLVNAAHRALHEALNVDAIDTSSTYVDENEKREHEPVAYFDSNVLQVPAIYRCSGGWVTEIYSTPRGNCTTPLYTAPPSKQEPVAWITRRTGDGGVVLSGYETCDPTDYDATPVYTATASKPWVSLSDEAAIKIVRKLGWGQSDFDVAEILEVVKAIDAALRSKNNG